MYVLSHSGLSEKIELKAGQSVHVRIDSGELPRLMYVASTANAQPEKIEFEQRGNDLIIRGLNQAELVLENYVLFCKQQGCNPFESISIKLEEETLQNPTWQNKKSNQEALNEVVESSLFIDISLPVLLINSTANQIVEQDALFLSEPTMPDRNNSLKGIEESDLDNLLDMDPFASSALYLIPPKDIAKPTITINSDSIALAAGQTAIVTFELSEPSSDFTLSDIQVEGGTLSNFTGSGTSYTATFTPTVQFAGTASISVASNSFADMAGNSNSDGADANNTVTMAVDTVRPVVEISSSTGTLAAGQTATITFELSEPSSDFTLGDIQVEGGTLSNFTGSGSSYSATFTPTVQFAGTASISVASNLFTDATGNSNGDGADANNSVSLEVDPILPTIEISSNAASLIAGQTATISFELSEASSNFTVSDVQVQGGTLSNFTGSGASYSATFTPIENYVGLANIAVASNSFTDAAGNSNSDGAEANNTVSVVVDTVRPVVEISSSAGILAAGQTATISFELSEASSDFTLNDIQVQGGTLSNFTGSGTSYTATFTPAVQFAGTASISVTSNSFTNFTGNSNADGADANNTANLTVLPGPVQLADIVNGIGGFAINGVNAFDIAGYSVSAAGDVNGDGLDDLIIGASRADPNGASSGQSYVVFGKADGMTVELADVINGFGGFTITGANAGDQSGFSVSAAGDVNGDGLADLLVGAPFSSANGQYSGYAFVVFGKTDGTPVQLTDVTGGVGGFAIQGANVQDFAGYCISAAGDVNGDGLSDLFVGVDFGDPNGSNSGQSYVVFGKTDGGLSQLADVKNGVGGFVINGINSNDQSGYYLSEAGDVNGDGLGDLIVGAFRADPNGSGSGQSYVVFGKASGTAVQLADVVNGTGGFAINGANVFDYSGRSVSAAGDVNGDGLADLIVGASDAGPNGDYSGQSYVVFGKADGTAVQLTDVVNGLGGFAINGINSFDQSGVSATAAGDVNGDGLADLIIGAASTDPRGDYSYLGQSYVVFGKADGTAVQLADVAANIGGFAINGVAPYDYAGRIVSAAGDVNGDGLADLIVGARYADPNGSSSGQSYVIFGSTGGSFSATAVDYLGSDSDDLRTADSIGQTLAGGAGNDVLSANGATILYGGSGNDTLVVDAGMITALQSNFGAGGNNGILSRIDGGTGIDTLSLNGANQILDLTRIANQAGNGPLGGSRIDSVEVIDLAGTGNNTLRFSVQDVLDMGSFNTFEATGRKQLKIDGNTGDTVEFADAANWSAAGTSQLDGTTYNTYQHTTSLTTVYLAENVSPVL